MASRPMLLQLPLRLLRSKHPENVRAVTEIVSAQPTRNFSSTPIAHRGININKKGSRRDPFAAKLYQARMAAVRARLKENRERKAAEMGDPIHGVSTPTPFVQSFDKPEAYQRIKLDAQESDHKQSQGQGLDGAGRPKIRLSHLHDEGSLRDGLAYAKKLSAPYIAPDRTTADAAEEARETQEHEAAHTARAEAVNRILSAHNASSRQRTRMNVQQCIDEFGRHNTDESAAAAAAAEAEEGEATTMMPPQRRKERVGPDTGSSEVQIAILTAKIRVLAAEYEGRSRNDKANKRNLRLLVHRRQKLLKYLERKERGGERWKHLLRTLGLTEATWKGEINVK